MTDTEVHKDVLGAELKVGDWFIQTAPFNQHQSRLQWGKVVGFTKLNFISYVTFIHDDKPHMDYHVETEWDDDLKRFVEVDRKPAINRMRWAGAAVLVIPEEMVPPIFVTQWNEYKQKTQEV